jgi:hypothetical protein
MRAPRLYTRLSSTIANYVAEMPDDLCVILDYNEAMYRIAYHDSEPDAVYARLSDVSGAGQIRPK